MLGREASPAGCRSGIERGKMIARCACSRRGSASGGDECPAPAGSARSRGLVVSGVTPPRGGGRHYRYEVDRPGTGRARDLDDARPGPGPGRVGGELHEGRGLHPGRVEAERGGAVVPGRPSEAAAVGRRVGIRRHHRPRRARPPARPGEPHRRLVRGADVRDDGPGRRRIPRRGHNRPADRRTPDRRGVRPLWLPALCGGDAVHPGNPAALPGAVGDGVRRLARRVRGVAHAGVGEGLRQPGTRGPDVPPGRPAHYRVERP